MFAPDGFLPFANFVQELEDHAQDFYAEHGMPTSAVGELEDRLDGYHTARAAERLFFDWLIDLCVYRQPIPVYLASPTGGLVAAAKDVFYAREQYSVYDFDWPLQRHNDELAQALEDRKGYDRKRKRNYVFLDYCFCIDAHQSVPKSVLAGDPLLIRAKSLLEAFDGWAICLRSSEVETLRAAIKHAYVWPRTAPKIDNEADKMPNSSSRLGRPRKIEPVWEVYCSLFPNGHEASGLGKKQVLELVGQQLRMPCSMDTLNRALGRRK